MKVLFGYSIDSGTVGAVYYQAEDGSVVEHVLLTDGTVRDNKFFYDSLAAFWYDNAKAWNPLYPAEVDDLRSAFKYLGKSSDLVELLPKAEMNNGE